MVAIIRIVHVCIPLTQKDYFDYHLTTDEPVQKGVRVLVPFHQGTRVGIVVGEIYDKKTRPLKNIQSVIDLAPVLSAEILSLCDWISRYYQTPLSQVLPMALPKHCRKEKVLQLPTTTYYYRANNTTQAPKRAHKLQALLTWMQPEEGYTLQQIVRAGFKKAQVTKLIALLLIIQESAPLLPTKPNLLPEQPLPLNHEQDLAVKAIHASLNKYQCFLLQGVTGSGKTEVYLQVIAQVLQAKQQVLVLVPEIGLTPQLIARFQQRFAIPIAVIHSNIRDTERLLAFQWARQGDIQLVIGTRSAIFTPLANLGLIIIDEEHDASLKQMDGVRYSARESALIRAARANIPIILGSATPSLESLYNCERNKYQLLRLTQRAMTHTPLHYQIIDIRSQSLQEGFAQTTLSIIQKHLSAEHQVLVFINRRGFAPVLMCHHCGWMADCHACDAHLTLHHNKLICHHCGSSRNKFTTCPSCGSHELIPIGMGTQRVAEFLTKYFVTTKVARLDRDALGHKDALNVALSQIDSGETQLIVGTQLLAKGHHFPRLTLVVILDADQGFCNHDFRALERLGQLLIQVAGRAGRAEHTGEVLIQTHLPTHISLNTLIKQGYETFAKELLLMRKKANLPPYSFIALIRAQAKIPERLLEFLHSIKQHLTTHLEVYGPAPSPLARIAHYHRMQLLLKSSSRKRLAATLSILRQYISDNKLDKGIQWMIDVDPMDLS